MMETGNDEMNGCLVRTNNGEWISEEYAVFKDEATASRLENEAKLLGLPLSKQTHYEEPWFYKHEVDRLMEAMLKEEEEEEEEEEET